MEPFHSAVFALSGPVLFDTQIRDYVRIDNDHGRPALFVAFRDRSVSLETRMLRRISSIPASVISGEGRVKSRLRSRHAGASLLILLRCVSALRFSERYTLSGIFLIVNDAIRVPFVFHYATTSQYATFHRDGAPRRGNACGRSSGRAGCRTTGPPNGFDRNCGRKSTGFPGFVA